RDAKAAQAKKLKQARRRALRERQNETALTAPHPDDTAQVRELRAALARAQGERNAAESGAHGPRRTSGPADRSIERPRNMAKVTIDSIRRALDLAGDEHDQRWADIRVYVRRFMDPGMIDLKRGWKEQDNRRLGKVYKAVRDAYPELRRFYGQWGTMFLVHESFGSRRTYKNCKRKDGSYRNRTRQARMSQLERQLRADSDDENLTPS
ncbi:hypothetical protein DFH06DRAFT_942654, partial [Mycena polygramma]